MSAASMFADLELERGRLARSAAKMAALQCMALSCRRLPLRLIILGLMKSAAPHALPPDMLHE